MRCSVIMVGRLFVENTLSLWGSKSMGAGTGILLIDFIVRPLLRFSFKFYVVGFIILFLVYGYIAYQALKSSYLSDQNTW